MQFHCAETEARRRATQIRALGLDVDGVLSDGLLYFSDTGEEIKAFHALDGQGIRMLLQARLQVAVITSRSSPIVQKRCADLGIEHVYQGVADKAAALGKFLSATGLQAGQLCFVGDDLMDLPVLGVAGLACSVPGGHEEVRRRVHVVTSAPGGRGAVREVADFLLRCQDRYQQFLPE